MATAPDDECPGRADQRHRRRDLVQALLHRREHARTDAENHEHHRAAQREGERGGEAVGDQAEDRLVVGERVPEAGRRAVPETGVVAAHEHARQPVPVLHRQRVVDAQVATDERERLRRAELAAGAAGRVARGDVEEDEGDRADDEEDHQRAERPAEDEAERGNHASAEPPAPVPGGRGRCRGWSGRRVGALAAGVGPLGRPQGRGAVSMCGSAAGRDQPTGPQRTTNGLRLREQLVEHERRVRGSSGAADLAAAQIEAALIRLGDDRRLLLHELLVQRSPSRVGPASGR